MVVMISVRTLNIGRTSIIILINLMAILMICTAVHYFISYFSFVAVFIVADIFMCSIDAITSKTKVF